MQIVEILNKPGSYGKKNKKILPIFIFSTLFAHFFALLNV